MNSEIRRGVIERLNYMSDHRVVARGQEPWFISVNGEQSHVAIKVPTDDYRWLTDNGYDPDEFENGARPTTDGHYVAGEDDCPKCCGTTQFFRHKKWKGVDFRPDGTAVRSHGRGYAESFREKPEDWELLDCTGEYGQGCIDGKRPVYEKFDEARLDPEAEDRPYRPFRVVAFPCKMAACTTCDGTGRHVNPSIDAGGLTQSDFDDDPGFREEYFSGMYDVTCYACDGAKSWPVVDVEALHPDELPLYQKFVEWREGIEREEAAYAAERRAEIRMGC